MLHDLAWQSLDGRRQDQRLVLFYKIINGLASVETEDILTPADSRTRKNHSFKFKHLQANCDSFIYLYTVFIQRTIHKLTCSNAHTDNKTQYKNNKDKIDYSKIKMSSIKS